MEYPTPADAALSMTEAISRIAELWEPPPDLLTSQWAEAYRVMPKGTSPRPGRWRNEKYQIEIMDVIDDPDVHEVVFIKPTQIGWSEILNNIIGKRMHIDPKPMMLVQPSLDDAKGYGKKRIAPMIEACTVLRERVRKSTSRRAGNTLLLKEFPGGFLKLTGANSGKGLRSDPLPVVLYDEADAMPDDVDGEGHPFDLGDNRTEGYSDWKSLKGSTPAKPKGLGKLEKIFEKSDRRRFHVPCPHCGFEQVLWWRDPVTQEYRLVWKRDGNGDVIPESVMYICAGCKRGIRETHKQRMLDGGRWIAEAPGRPTVGFHINALYRPWKDNWAAMAQKWVDAQGDHEALKEFIMLQLAEFWDSSGESIDAGSLQKRKEAYPMIEGMPPDYPRPWEYQMIPFGVAIIVCVFDVQGNRIEGKIVGYGAGEQSWLIAHEVFWGDPGTDEALWELVEQFRLRQFKHESGAVIHPVISLIDSGDQSDAVYDYVQPRQNLTDRVFATKGVEFHTKPMLVQEGTTKRHNVRLFTIATHSAKDRINSRLRLAQPGPGYMHFPLWTTDEYFSQLTAEKKVSETNKRTRVRKTKWLKIYARNEALDLEVMALAAVFILQNYIDPALFRDLGMIASALRGDTQLPAAPTRRMRSRGIE